MEFTPEILEKLAKSANGLPVYLDQRPPELEDPAQALGPHHWQPACETTSRLTRCLEAIRDLAGAMAMLQTAVRPEDDKRLVKQAIIPVYNLAIAQRDLYNHVQSTQWQKLTKGQKDKLVRRFKRFTAAVPTQGGTLKATRDKIAAHLDKELCTTEYRQFWDAFSLADVLGWIRGCMKLLEPLLHPDVYSWTRFSGYSNVWNLMNVDGNEVSIRIEEGHPTAIVGFKFVVSPKAGIVREARELVSICYGSEQRVSLRSDLDETASASGS